MITFDALPENQLFALFDDDNAANLGNKFPGMTIADHKSLRDNLIKAGFVNIVTDNYSVLFDRNLFGIYVVSVSEDAPNFLGGYDRYRNVLYEIPINVIEAAKNQKLVIVIDNQSEGRALNYADFDGFKEIHSAMTTLELPRSSVVLINGDALFHETYEQWRQENWKNIYLQHVYFAVWTWIFNKPFGKPDRIPDHPLILDALKTNSKDFNSLNRSARPHRVEHLYFLAKNNILDKGIVSGHWNNSGITDITEPLHQPRLLDIDRDEFTKVLSNVLPIEADGPWLQANPDDSDQHIFNHDIYKNSLVTVVTETHFISRGAFLTEKIFKPIVAGHPFILLGSWRTLEVLRKLGYRTDFDMFDDSYDKIISNKDRFDEVNRQLLRWVSLSPTEKEQSILKSMDAIIHNQTLFKTKDYTTDAYKNLYAAVEFIRQESKEYYGINKSFKQQF
jgi:hypothetical protein